jgi:hypothetical protein
MIEWCIASPVNPMSGHYRSERLKVPGQGLIYPEYGDLICRLRHRMWLHLGRSGWIAAAAN